MSVRLTVSIAAQRLDVWAGGASVCHYPVSTALAGAGERNGSGCTPRGPHYIRACIGAGQPLGAVFIGRRPTGEIYTDALAAQYPQRDWILSRILWLCGLEVGFNRGADVDTQRRYIYIHGTPDTEPMGVPLSHGCIRMRNADLIELFEQVQPGTPVLIEE
ncbi:MAG: L,D-transpeptidase [Oceanospirillales bacterium]|uniref:L,D-transpeptidase-like protein n=1 Tax=Marinobacterium halophilum TaxID=267374 RepID=A0A2P8F0G4_9GAMM|nr:L,D-transpeptidase [Marinobacterium halophilum]MBR9828324.1 L,D-transpeptidase [Oceanospirillales bacterium]PSL15168.1 L,D-transpeptidase-like protein [Marinobacterium halophilum]